MPLVYSSMMLYYLFCLHVRVSLDATYALYINGLDWNENPVELLDILQRGVELKMLLDVWLSKW